MAVKQLFETYVYHQTLSSIDKLPFVIGGLNPRRRGPAAITATVADDEESS
ncbi:hypothetical protein [Pseudomonas fluorescens]|uniref:hypothetical protein n=1 Tax=Pseudomonas fluorescens TaxID=294 RepID=UPI00177B31C2|nr:hypothetical protein [Pseudomonas fluorescens]